jgi:hypothetical protein
MHGHESPFDTGPILETIFIEKSILKVGTAIELLSGTMFDYTNPAASEVDIEDIASALSNVCRFSGHLPQFYSVAQHAVNVSNIVAAGHEKSGLLHDTAEAFTNDLPTPLKTALPVFKDLEVAIESAMAERFNFQYPLSDEVKLADLQMLKIEKEYIKRCDSHWQLLDGVETDHLMDRVILDELTPRQARELFLLRWEEVKNG